MTLSVIIPVYNAATYLEACVLSLRALSSQMGFGMEIVMVDDGSTDDSGEMCDRLADQVLHQPNQGVSVARNAGIGIAKGDWLWFVDADDYVETINNSPFKTEDLLHRLENADFVNLGFVWEEKHRGYAKREAHMQVTAWEKHKHESATVKARLFGNGAERKRWMKNLYAHCPLYVRPIIYFLGRYILLGGFLDGYAGWYWHTRQGLMYRMMVDREIRKLTKS